MPPRLDPIAVAAARITDAILARLSDVGHAHSIPQFCARQGMSKSHYYDLPLEDRPEIMEINGLKRVTPEAEARWRNRHTKPAQEFSGQT